jgi:hypothetical protein
MDQSPLSEEELQRGLEGYKSETMDRDALTLEVDTFWEEEEKMLGDFPEIFQQNGCIPERKHLKCLTKWKWPGLWANHANENTQDHLRTVTSEAFQMTAGDERPEPEDVRNQLGLLDDELTGVSAATGTVLLTFWRPDVYTVMDVRAISTLEFAGLWTGDSGATISEYPQYLEQCHSIAEDTKLNLRDIDRAIWYLGGEYSDGSSLH